MKITSKESLKPFKRRANTHTRSHRMQKGAVNPTDAQLQIFVRARTGMLRGGRTFMQDCGICHTQLQLRGIERALFPNVTDFIVSGHRQTCSFS